MMNIQAAVHAEWNEAASHSTTRHANQSSSKPGQETNFMLSDGGTRLSTQLALIFSRLCTKELFGCVAVNNHCVRLKVKGTVILCMNL